MNMYNVKDRKRMKQKFNAMKAKESGRMKWDETNENAMRS
jgi:hypothetical protein